MNSTNRLAIIALTLTTALIHLYLSGGTDTLFILNGIGFLVLLAVMYLPMPFLDPYRSIASWGLVAFSAVTIVAYFVVNPDPFGSALGLLTKAIEVAIIVLVVMDKRQGG